MSMHLRGSSDMMRSEEEGWWTSRTGLEQKLIILCTVLFIVAFSLTISTIVYKNRSSKGDTTTVAPPPTTSPVTGETSTTSVTGDTSPETGSTGSSVTEIPPSSSSEPSSSLATPTPTPEPTTISESPKSTPASLKEGKALPLESSGPLMSLLKEANRVNEILEKQKLTGA